MMWDNTGVTVELGEIVESGVNIWDFEYPVPRSKVDYNGKTCTVDFNKTTFEQKIIDHFRFRQIGQETVGRFLHCFRTRIREIMPYYVQVYEFDAKFRNIEDPLESYNLTETFKQNVTNTGHASGTNNGTSNKTSKFSDTPQGAVSNLDNYLTNATVDNFSDNGSTVQDTNNTGKTDHTLTRKGNIGVQPLGGEVLNIRSAFINIDLQIIGELNDLFLGVY